MRFCDAQRDGLAGFVWVSRAVALVVLIYEVGIDFVE